MKKTSYYRVHFGLFDKNCWVKVLRNKEKLCNFATV